MMVNKIYDDTFDETFFGEVDLTDVISEFQSSGFDPHYVRELPSLGTREFIKLYTDSKLVIFYELGNDTVCMFYPIKYMAEINIFLREKFNMKTRYIMQLREEENNAN